MLADTNRSTRVINEWPENVAQFVPKVRQVITLDRTSFGGLRGYVCMVRPLARFVANRKAMTAFRPNSSDRSYNRLNGSDITYSFVCGSTCIVITFLLAPYLMNAIY